MWQFQPKPDHLQPPTELSVIYEIASSIGATRRSDFLPNTADTALSGVRG